MKKKKTSNKEKVYTELPYQILKTKPEGIGGTDAARIVAGDWRNLYDEKKGFKEREDLNNVLPVRMGIHTESFNRQWYMEQTGNYLSEPLILKNIRRPYMIASLDALTYGPDGKGDFTDNSVWDAKHTNAFMKQEKIFEKYYPQMQHYMLVTELENAVLSVFYGNMKYEILDIAKDEEFQWNLLKAEMLFWKMILDDQEPPDHMDWTNFTQEKINDKGNIQVSVLAGLQESNDKQGSSTRYNAKGEIDQKKGSTDN